MNVFQALGSTFLATLLFGGGPVAMTHAGLIGENEKRTDLFFSAPADSPVNRGGFSAPPEEERDLGVRRLALVDDEAPAAWRALAQLEVLGLWPRPDAFLRAAATGQEKLIDLFLTAGSDINTLDARERTPLLSAALRRDWATVRYLLSRGADPNLADREGQTPLFAAVTGGHGPTVEALLAVGASPTTLDAQGRNALQRAIAYRQSSVVEALLLHLPNAPECSAALVPTAFEIGDRGLLEAVLRHVTEPLPWTPAARSAFARAVAIRDTILGPLIMAKFVGSPAPSEQAQPSLAYAVASGDLKQIRTLLDFGVDPNTVLNQPGDKTFRSWISSEYVRYYLETAPGLNVLMLAAGVKQVEVIRLLLAYGANRTAETGGKNRLIPLYFAAWSDSPEGIQALMTNAPTRAELWIDVSLNDQRARFYREGALVLNTSISTGRDGFPTKPGEYVITDKHRDHRSSIYHEASMPFFMRLSCRDFGLHQGVVTGRPASHGCIRLPGDVAQRLFKEVPIGTWVSVRR